MWDPDAGDRPSRERQGTDPASFRLPAGHRHAGHDETGHDETGHDRTRNDESAATADIGRETAQISSWIKQGVFLALAVTALYLFSPQILDVISSAERIRTIRPGWLLVMVVLEILSFVCAWWLIRIVLPEVSWFVVSTSHLVANAVSRIWGGAASGGATLYRMLSVSGVSNTKAAGALAATSILSTAALFAIPAAGFLMALLGAPVPEALWPAAVAGGVLFVLLVFFGWLAVGHDRPLLAVGRSLDRVTRFLSVRFGRTWSVRPERLLEERDRLIDVLGHRWGRAVSAAALNWVFDYLALVAALYAVGADPRLSLVLLAFSGAAVLAMIPITPGGLGFVEAGLWWLLVVSGISSQDALLATAAWRFVSLWLPILCGVPAWLAHRRRYRSVPVS